MATKKFAGFSRLLKMGLLIVLVGMTAFQDALAVQESPQSLTVSVKDYFLDIHPDSKFEALVNTLKTISVTVVFDPNIPVTQVKANVVSLTAYVLPQENITVTQTFTQPGRIVYDVYMLPKWPGGYVDLHVQVSDGISNVDQKYDLYVQTINSLPIMEDIADQPVAFGQQAKVSFTAIDLDISPYNAFTNLFSIPTSASASDGTPIFVENKGPNYTLTFTPTQALTVTVVMYDGIGSSKDVFRVIEPLSGYKHFLPLVLKPSKPPTITAYNFKPFLSNVSLLVGESSGGYGILSDIDTIISECSLSITSSNQTVIPNQNIVLHMNTDVGSYHDVSFDISFKAASLGKTILTIVASDGQGGVSSHQIQVNVVSGSHPTIGTIPAQHVKINQETTITFTASDADGDYPLTFELYTQGTYPDFSPFPVYAVFSGSAPTYTLKLTVPKYALGTVSIWVKDSSGLYGATSFDLYTDP